jgi:hypothetical protein
VRVNERLRRFVTQHSDKINNRPVRQRTISSKHEPILDARARSYHYSKHEPVSLLFRSVYLFAASIDFQSRFTSFVRSCSRLRSENGVARHAMNIARTSIAGRWTTLESYEHVANDRVYDNRSTKTNNIRPMECRDLSMCNETNALDSTRSSDVITSNKIAHRVSRPSSFVLPFTSVHSVGRHVSNSDQYRADLFSRFFLPSSHQFVDSRPDTSCHTRYQLRQRNKWFDQRRLTSLRQRSLSFN